MREINHCGINQSVYRPQVVELGRAPFSLRRWLRVNWHMIAFYGAALLVLVLLLICSGCTKPSKPPMTYSGTGTLSSSNGGTGSSKLPCAPPVSQEMGNKPVGMVKATITPIVQPSRASWSENHEVDCPENMRTVFPSFREHEKQLSLEESEDADEQWYAEHTYCIPDGEKP